jgi:hypothetical protein
LPAPLQKIPETIFLIIDDISESAGGVVGFVRWRSLSRAVKGGKTDKNRHNSKSTEYFEHRDTITHT